MISNLKTNKDNILENDISIDSEYSVVITEPTYKPMYRII